MPKKADTTEEKVTEASDVLEVQMPKEPEVTEEPVPKVLKPFTYPTIGQGVTIWAADQEDAERQAAVHPLRKVS